MNDKFWKYPLAIIASILALFIVNFVVNVVMSLTNYIIPLAYQNTKEWINIVAIILATTASLNIVDYIVPNSKKFTMVISVIYAVYLIAVGVWNYALGSTGLFGMIALIAGGISAIYYLVQLVNDK